MNDPISTLPGQTGLILDFARILMYSGAIILLPAMIAHPSSNIPGCLRKPIWIPVHIGETFAHAFFGLGVLLLLPALPLGPITTGIGIVFASGMIISALFILCQAFVMPLVDKTLPKAHTMVGLATSGRLHKGIFALMVVSAPLHLGGGLAFAIMLLVTLGLSCGPAWLILGAILLIGALNVLKGTPERLTGVIYAMVMGAGMIWLAGIAGQAA